MSGSVNHYQGIELPDYINGWHIDLYNTNLEDHNKLKITYRKQFGEKRYLVCLYKNKKTDFYNGFLKRDEKNRTEPVRNFKNCRYFDRAYNKIKGWMDENAGIT